MRNRFIALVSAAALSLSIAGTALAAPTINQTDSLTVQSTITVDGIPATVTYPAAAVGTTASATPFVVDVTANTAWGLTISQTDLTGPGGTISKANRTMTFSGFTLATQLSGTAGDPLPGDSSFFSGTIIGTAAPGGARFTVALAVAVPAGQAPGVYTGSITYAFN